MCLTKFSHKNTQANKMKLFKSVFILLILFQTLVTAQNESKVLAKAGNRKITAREFIERFEFVPQLNRKETNIERKKEELLYTIIAEKLFAQEAEKLRLDTTEIMKFTFPAMEKMYVRDALYKNAIQSNVKVNPEKISEGLKKYRTVLNVNYIYSQNQSEVKKIYKELLNGASFDSLLNGRTESFEQPYKVEYGKMFEDVEDSLYNLQIGEFTAPIQSPEGWYIFKLQSIEDKPIPKNKSLEDIKREVTKIEKERAENRIYQNFYKQFFKNKQVTADGTIFWSLVDKLAFEIKQNKITANIPDGEKIIFDSNNLRNIEKKFGADSLNLPFVKFPESSVTLKQFLREFMFEGFYTFSTDPKTIAAQLNSRVKRFIEMELLAREGFDKGLNSSPDVKPYIQMWRDNYLAQLYKRNLIRSVSVTDEEAKKHYLEENKKFTPVKEVNIIEILTDSLDVVADILKKLDEGADIRELARIHTKRKWTKDKGGEFGFFPVTMYGELGKIAGELEVGEIYGPLELNEGFSIFKVIGKREPEIESPESFDKVKEKIKAKLKAKKIDKLLTDKTVELAGKYGVSVDLQALKSVKVNNINMLVYKYFGFGGRTLAFPVSAPFYKWYDKLKSGEKVLP